MPDLFGAPLGDMAYSQTALRQMQTLGQAADISLTPDRRNLLQAQTRGAEAKALTAETAAARLAASDKWDDAYRESEQKRKKVADAALAAPLVTGHQLHAMDVPDNVDEVNNPMLRQAEWLRKQGAPDHEWMPLYTKGKEVQKGDNINRWRRAQASSQETTARIAKNKELGELAWDASASPEAFNTLMMTNPRASQLLPKEMQNLPWFARAKALEHIARQATTKEQEDKAELAKEKEARAKALAEETGEYYDEMKRKAKVDADLKELDLEMRRKTGGHASEEHKAALEALTNSRDMEGLMLRLAASIPLPADPEEYVVYDPDADPAMRPYTSKDGNIHAWYMGYENGEHIWDPVSPVQMERLMREAEARIEEE